MRTKVRLPDRLIVLQNDNGVKYACVDCSIGKVVTWDLVCRDVITSVPRDFFDHVLEWAKEGIEFIES